MVVVVVVVVGVVVVVVVVAVVGGQWQWQWGWPQHMWHWWIPWRMMDSERCKILCSIQYYEESQASLMVHSRFPKDHQVSGGSPNWVDKSEMATWLIPENQMRNFLKCLTRNGNENNIFGGGWQDFFSISCVRHLIIDQIRISTWPRLGMKFFVWEWQRNLVGHSFTSSWGVLVSAGYCWLPTKELRI